MAYTDETEEHAPEIEATDARQGRWGRHMLWVLLVSLTLAFAALLGAWVFRSGDLGAVEPPPAAIEAVPAPPNAG